MSQNKLRSAIVTSKTLTLYHEMNEGVLQFLPVACYVYLVGKNTINKTKTVYGF